MIFANCTLDTAITKANLPADGAEQNPPQWPKSVSIITSNMTDEEAQKKLTELQETPVEITKDMVFICIIQSIC